MKLEIQNMKLEIQTMKLEIQNMKYEMGTEPYIRTTESLFEKPTVGYNRTPFQVILAPVYLTALRNNCTLLEGALVGGQLSIGKNHRDIS